MKFGDTVQIIAKLREPCKPRENEIDDKHAGQNGRGFDYLELFAENLKAANMVKIFKHGLIKSTKKMFGLTKED